jgi:hypothetical protein
MKRVYRTANGKTVDLDGLILVNEQTIAIGNMNVNARGDELGPGGKVVATRNQTMDDYYRLNTNSTARSRAEPDQVLETRHKTQGARLSQGTTGAPDPVEEEQPLLQDTPLPKRQGLRGNLADSVARSTVVEQPIIAPPGEETKGPRRI